MTRAQIEYLINIHEKQREFAKAYLDRYYSELERDGKEDEWLKRYVYHKKAVDQLNQEIAEDE